MNAYSNWTEWECIICGKINPREVTFCECKKNPYYTYPLKHDVHFQTSGTTLDKDKVNYLNGVPYPITKTDERRI